MHAKTRNELMIAYLRTLYGVLTAGGEFFISPLSENPELAAFCKENGIAYWAVITPMNPGSKNLHFDENAKRLREFAEELKGFVTLSSTSKPAPDTHAIVGEPVSETGFFIQNIFPWEAVKLGVKWGQNAILLGRGNGEAEVVWTDHESGIWFSRGVSGARHTPE